MCKQEATKILWPSLDYTLSGQNCFFDKKEILSVVNVFYRRKGRPRLS